MLILKALSREPMHGYGIAKWIQATTQDALSVEEGSLYPALHRMERRGWIVSEWGRSESNRRAKYYKLSQTGRAQLRREKASWDALVRAVSLIFDAQPKGGTA